MTIPHEYKNKNQRSRTDIYEMLFHSRRFGHIQKKFKPETGLKNEYWLRYFMSDRG